MNTLIVLFIEVLNYIGIIKCILIRKCVCVQVFKDFLDVLVCKFPSRGPHATAVGHLGPILATETPYLFETSSGAVINPTMTLSQV